MCSREAWQDSVLGRRGSEAGLQSKVSHAMRLAKKIRSVGSQTSSSLVNASHRSLLVADCEVTSDQPLKMEFVPSCPTGTPTSPYGDESPAENVPLCFLDMMKKVPENKVAFCSSSNHNRGSCTIMWFRPVQCGRWHSFGILRLKSLSDFLLTPWSRIRYDRIFLVGLV